MLEKRKEKREGSRGLRRQLNEFLDELLVCIEQLPHSAGTAASLRRALGSPEMKSLLRLHQAVSQTHAQQLQPRTTQLGALMDDICSWAASIHEQGALELLRLLNSVHLQALASAHDSVALRCFEPQLCEVPFEVDEDEGFAIKIVTLIKNHEPLGATIKKQEPGGAVVVARIMHGGLADRSGCVHVGDRVVEVNGVSVDGMSPAEIVKLLSSAGDAVTFKLVPASAGLQNGTLQSQASAIEGSTDSCCAEQPFLRALFNYEPKLDPCIPCSQAGLRFRKGDVLQVVSMDDAHWWQARLERVLADSPADNRSRVGLIPSKLLQEKKQQFSRSQSQDVVGADSGTGSWHRARKTPPAQLPQMFEMRSSEQLDNIELHIYEEVARLFPQAGAVLSRPLVLIGPPGVGRNELKRRLLLLDSRRFATSVPHTSRPPRAGEVDGVEYHFASRAQMQQWVDEGRFIEHGEYKGQLYGTTADAVLQVLRHGRQCILCPHPQALRLLRTAAFKPVVVFVRPPPLDILKHTRQSPSCPNAARFTDSQLQAMLDSASRLYHLYAHCFDLVLTNDHLDACFRSLCDQLASLASEPQWVPASWVR